MNKIIHIFFFIGLILVILFGLSYAQLALFLKKESESVTKVQNIQTEKLEIQALMRNFYEIRFWERVIFFQSTPVAERRFGELLQKLPQHLDNLKTGVLSNEITDNLEGFRSKLIDYETTFEKIGQYETSQRLGLTLIENVFQSLIANILREQDNSFLRSMFSLSQFMSRYQESNRPTEYQSLKIVLQSLNNKASKLQNGDRRLAEYISKYSELLEKDFERAQEIKELNERFDQISDQISDILKTMIETANNAVAAETKSAAKLRSHLNLSFSISVISMIIGVPLIALYVFRQIINPIQALSTVANNVRKGIMSSRFTPRRRSSQDLIDLGNSFNLMLDTLARRENDLEMHRASLEEKVAQRTEKLSEINVALKTEITSRAEVERQLEQYAHKQAVLLEEVNHRVKNNLISIISMLHQEEDRVSFGYPTKPGEYLTDLVGKINGLLAVHSLLSSSKWEPLAVSHLSKKIIQGGFKGIPEGHTIELTVSPSDVVVNSDHAHYLAVVLNELATNSKKYAFANRDTAQVISP